MVDGGGGEGAGELEGEEGAGFEGVVPGRGGLEERENVKRVRGTCLSRCLGSQR